MAPVDEMGKGTARRKRLAYQCAHRGMREMDLILGAFAERALASLTGAELDQLEAVLDVADDLLYRWIAGAEAVPPEHMSAILTRIIAETRGVCGAS
jgi:antitoxin CptB